MEEKRAVHGRELLDESKCGAGRRNALDHDDLPVDLHE
jgi:hypothetical protein